MVDVWRDAPEGATHWGHCEGNPYFWKIDGFKIGYWTRNGDYYVLKYSDGDKKMEQFITTLTPRPAPEWPSDNRIDVIGQNGPSGEHYSPPVNKYDRVIHGKYGGGAVTVDVYRVLNAFGPLSPEIDHAAKKLLAAGSRGHKDEKQDLLEAIQSIEARLKYLEDSNVN